MSYREKQDAVERLERLLYYIRREQQSGQNEIAIVKLEKQIEILQLECKLALTSKSLELFDLYIKCGSMRVALHPKFDLQAGMSDPTIIRAEVIEGSPRRTGNAVRDVWEVAYEAGCIASKVLNAN